MVGILGGCELHGRTREEVLAAWRHSMTVHALETGSPALVYCACCDGPALADVQPAEDELGNDLPGGVSRPVTCVKCLVETMEQAVDIMRRLNAGYPVSA